MKSLKKLGAIVLALVLVCALAAPAFAATTAVSGGVATPATGSYLNTDGISIAVNFTPEEGLTTPAYTFSYSIAAANGVAGNPGPEVKAGVGTPTITASAVFAAGETTKTLTVGLSGLDFTAAGAGIYRYKITQDAISNDGVTAGILNDKGNGAIEVRYLDLYVDKDGHIVNAVLFKLNGALPAAVNNEISYSGNDLIKVDAFENTFGKKGNDDPDPDDPSYPLDPDDPKPSDSGKHTVTLSKAIDGNMASSTQKFPFEITLTDNNGVSLTGVKCKVEGTGGTPDIDSLKDANNEYYITLDTTTAPVSTVYLKGGDSIKITVPNNITVKVQEKITAGEGYIVTDEVTGEHDATYDVDGTAQADASGANAKYTDETGLAVKLNADGHSAAFAYTNTRNSISPTGVVLRFAPFVIMIGAAVVLLASRRRKAEEC